MPRRFTRYGILYGLAVVAAIVLAKAMGWLG